MAEQNQDGVVELVDAGVPADQGLSSLGMLMQLAGNVFAAYAGLLAFMMLMLLRGQGETLWMFIILGASIARSLFQRAAGTQLLYGSSSLETDGKNHRMRGMYRYIGFALLQTALVAGLLFGKFDVAGKMTLGIAGGLAVWPVFLAVIVTLPRFRRFHTDLPLTEDKGFEGASILMTVLGLCGAVGTATVLLVLLDMPGKALTKGPGVLVALALAMLLVRSVLHVQAGLSGLRETSVDRSVELVNRYANFGVISAFCGGGAMLLFVMSSSMNIGGLAVIAGVCWMLMSWPLIVRRFFSDRQFADLMAGDQAPVHRRAPDAGLTGLGWLLVAHAAFSATFLIPQLVIDPGEHTGRELAAFMSLGGGLGLRSIWFSVGLVVLQSWAGYELVRMSKQSRVIATVFGVVGAVVTVYINWPIIQMMKHAKGFIGQSETMMLGPLAMALIIPVATLVLVNRKIAPTARARFRKPAPQAPTETPPA